MPLEVFSFEKLPTMDAGRVRATFDQALRRAEADCRDRPDVEKPRTITLTVQLTPLMHQGALDSIDIDWDVKGKEPSRKGRTYNMKATQAGLLFNEASPDDINQGTLDNARKPTATKGA